LIAISQIEAHPPRGESVHRRSARDRIAVAPQGRLEVIDKDEQYIRPIGQSGCRRAEQAYHRAAEQENRAGGKGVHSFILLANKRTREKSSDEVLEPDTRYPTCPEQEAAKVAEPTSLAPTMGPPATLRVPAQRELLPVIPLVSPDRAAEIFSSQRVMSWEEAKTQIDRSLGRLSNSA